MVRDSIACSWSRDRLLSQMRLQRGEHRLVDEPADVAPEGCDFAHEAGRDIAILLCRGEKKGLHLGRQAPVHAGKLELVIEIGDGAQSPQYGLGLAPSGEIAGKKG